MDSGADKQLTEKHLIILLILKRNQFLSRHFFSKDETDKTVLLSCVFSSAMLLFRIFYTGEWLFLFLLWNLCLAYLPYLISSCLQKHPGWIEEDRKFVMVFTGWLLLLPNSFYILTDLFHLRRGVLVPQWFDLAMIFSFAWNGLLLGVLSLRQMEKIVLVKWHLKNRWFFLAPVIFLCALGIYIGRYLRYNSWDVLTNPFGLIADIYLLLRHPVDNRFDWGMITCFSVLLCLFYNSIRHISNRMK
jgi:uncharacterized membrane protein